MVVSGYMYSQKRFYNRKTNSACILCKPANVYQTPIPFYTTQIIKPFLNLIISAKHENKIDKY